MVLPRVRSKVTLLAWVWLGSDTWFWEGRAVLAR